jgi:hypothetical protein
MYNADFYDVPGKPSKTKEKVKVSFYAMLTDFRNNISLWTVPRLRPSALQVRTTSR